MPAPAAARTFADVPLTVIAGYDGSPASRAAVAHALDRTGPDGDVVVVHACGSALDPALERGSQLLDALGEIDPRVGEWGVRTELVTSSPASALAAAART